MSRRHNTRRRRSYGRRQHELGERRMTFEREARHGEAAQEQSAYRHSQSGGVDGERGMTSE
jgi:hypothetical protein